MANNAGVNHMIFGEMLRKSDKGFSDQLIAMSEDDRITRLIPADAKAHWRNDHVTLIQHTLWNTAESRADHNPEANADNQPIIAAWARIDNRTELGEKLGINASNPEISDSNFILSAYQKWGEDCVEHLVGDFVFVIFDIQKQKLFCARDHMGVRPLYYHLSDNRFIFGTSLMIFHQLEGFELKPSQQWMANFLLSLSMGFDATPYPDILKLPPAHCLTVSATGSYLRQYFRFTPESTLQLNDSREYVDAYREMLEESIRCRLRSEHPIGTELSGGIDSSSIAAYAASLLSQPQSQLHAFAFSGYQREPELIHAVNQAYPMAATHMFPYPSDYTEYPQLIDQSLNVLGYPAEFANAIDHTPFYQVAEGSGIRTLLSGFGGDEFVSNHGVVAQIELLTGGEYRKLYQNTRGNPLARVLRMLKLALRWQYTKKRHYAPGFYESYSQRWPHQPIKDEWVSRFDLHRHFMEEAIYDSGYSNLNAFILERCWTPFVTARTENCTLMAASRKIEYRWPLLDVRLISLFLSIPASEKYAHGTGRWLHRRAIDGIVPKTIAWNPSKDMGPSDTVEGSISPPQIKLLGLHPALRKILDPKKMAIQLETLSHSDKNQEGDELDQFYENIQNINILNQWLSRIQA